MLYAAAFISVVAMGRKIGSNAFKNNQRKLMENPEAVKEGQARLLGSGSGIEYQRTAVLSL